VAVLIFFALPWLDRGRVKSIRYRGPRYRGFFAAFVIAFLILGYLGVEPTTVWGAFPNGMPIVGVIVFLAVFSIVVFFLPEMGGYFLEANNFIPADPLKTPEHIAPVWYFTPYYAMLRAVPSFLDTQVWGVIVMGVSVLIFFAMPWLDRSPVKSIRYKGPLYKGWLAAFVVAFLILGYLGVVPVTVWGQFAEGFPFYGADKATVLARVLTVVYFLFFLLMPWYTARDRTKPQPSRVTWK